MFTQRSLKCVVSCEGRTFIYDRGELTPLTLAVESERRKFSIVFEFFSLIDLIATWYYTKCFVFCCCSKMLITLVGLNNPNLTRIFIITINYKPIQQAVHSISTNIKSVPSFVLSLFNFTMYNLLLHKNYHTFCYATV